VFPFFMSKSYFVIFVQMNHPKKVNPNNFSCYDNLESYKARKILLNITLTNDLGTEQNFQSRIIDFHNIYSEEILYLENGDNHRLDSLSSINPVE